MKTIKMKLKRSRTHSYLKTTAKDLLNIKAIPTTEVCEYVYGSKSKKSTLNQKKTGLSPIQFEESLKIIAFYEKLSQEIDDIINS